MVVKEVTKFLKSRAVKSPTRGYPTDAGIDFFVPVFNTKFIKDFKEKNPLLFEEPDCGCWATNGIAVASSGTFMMGGNAGTVSYGLNDEEKDTFFKFDEEKATPYFNLSPHARVNIPSGIHSRMTKEGRALIAFNKSGVATKLGLDVGACVVDYTYQGEIHLSLINTSTNVVRIYQDMKIVQFVETPVFTNDIEITESTDVPATDYLKFYEGMKQDRKDGGFGSTDKK